jgi:hypothetical protein
MRRIGLLSVLATTALAAPLAASAKGPDRARVCGADRCTAVQGSAARALLDWGGQAGFEILPAPRRVPFFRVTLYDRGHPVWRLVYAPSVGRVRITQLDVYPYEAIAPYWRAITPAGKSALGRSTRELRPFPAPRSWG